MPSRDASGRPISGTETRRRAAERSKPEPAWFDGENPFDTIPPPPLEATAELITWGAKVHAVSLDYGMRHPEMFPNPREWLRFVLEGTTRLGMIRDKAAEQERIKKGLKQRQGSAEAESLEDVGGRKSPRVSRPT